MVRILIFGLVIWLHLSEVLYGQVLPAKKLQADLEQMRAALEAWHPGYAQYQPRDSLQIRFEALSHRIDQPMTAGQFLRVARLASAEIQCLHTTVSLPVSPKKAANFTKTFFPLNVTLTRDHQLLNCETGDTIRQINERSVQVIVDSLLMPFSSDGPNQSLKQWIVNQQFAALYAARFGMPDTFRLVFSTRLGLLKEEIMTGKKQKDLTTPYLADQSCHIIHTSRDITLYALSRQPDVAVLQIRSIGGALNQFRLRRIMHSLHKKSVRHLILDLRNNTGGRVWTATTLLKYLLPQVDTVLFERYQNLKSPTPFTNSNRLFRFLYNTRLSLRTTINRTTDRVQYSYTIYPNKRQFDGKLIVLINGGTASAASLIAAYLQEQNRATFIGEETGGSRYISAGMLVPTLRLKYSGLRVKVPLFQVIHNSKTTNDGHGVRPGVLVESCFPGNDRVIQKAIELSSQLILSTSEQP